MVINHFFFFLKICIYSSTGTAIFFTAIARQVSGYTERRESDHDVVYIVH